ncbi:MAG: deoxyribonuclease IV [Spirochaetales bacterium]|nr:deoxyribonuclease IV [Spirochaetales bacterium]
MNTTPLVGAHLSIGGGVDIAIDRARSLGCPVLQLFTHNPRQWSAAPIPVEVVRRFREKQRKTGLILASHASYLINPVSAKNEVRTASRDLLSMELRNTQELGIPFLVIHPGSTGNSDEKTGIREIASTLDDAIETSGNEKTSILLETTAGHAHSIGYRFEHLRDIIGAARYRSRYGVCFDTCHVFASGYDLVSEEAYERTMRAFDDTIGLSLLKFIHLNDCLFECGARRDRHTHIGKGKIGPETFVRIMNDARFIATGKCIETPKGKKNEWDKLNLTFLRQCV